MGFRNFLHLFDSIWLGVNMTMFCDTFVNHKVIFNDLQLKYNHIKRFSDQNMTFHIFSWKLFFEKKDSSAQHT